MKKLTDDKNVSGSQNKKIKKTVVGDNDKKQTKKDIVGDNNKKQIKETPAVVNKGSEKNVEVRKKGNGFVIFLLLIVIALLSFNVIAETRRQPINWKPKVTYEFDDVATLKVNYQEGTYQLTNKHKITGIDGGYVDGEVVHVPGILGVIAIKCDHYSIEKDVSTWVDLDDNGRENYGTEQLTSIFGKDLFPKDNMLNIRIDYLHHYVVANGRTIK